MAKDSKVEEERVYVIPLRAVKQVPKWRRSKRAISEIRQYLARHLSAEEDKVRLDRSINERIWQKGSSDPPNKIVVRAMKFEDGIVEAELATES
jgi:large subunit ribosomal protein L31e